MASGHPQRRTRIMGQRSRIIGAFAAVALGLLGSFLGGCQEGEKYVYKSTPHVPETVTLINTTTGEQVWSYDIPAGQELTVRFKEPGKPHERAWV